MEKRSIYKVLALFFAVATLWGCKKSEADFEKKLIVNTDYIEVASKSNSYTFEILSNQNIDLLADVDWIVFDTSALNKGKHLVKFTTVTNEDSERNGKITVKVNEQMTKEILVIQESGLVSMFYVKTGATGAGSSWDDATDLTTAIANATSGSIINIAEGTYMPTKTISGGDPVNDSDKTFEINKNLTIIGGFASNALIGDNPDPIAYPTILSGNSIAFHVVTVTALAASEEKVTLEGLTIKEGYATDRSTNISINGKSFSRGIGGGITIGGSNILLKNVNIIDNGAGAGLGSAGQCAGIYAFEGATVEMRNCKISNNSTVGNQGGVWINSSKAYIYDTQIIDNSATGTAPGLHGYPDAELYVYNSEIKNNSNRSFGAGLYLRQGSKGFIVNTIISGNETTSANGGGGVMMYDNCDATFISSTITGNSAVGPGGGIYRRQNSNSLTLINTIVSGNSQRASSTDVDTYVADAGPFSVKNSIIETKAYDGTGAEVTSASFTAATMFNTNLRLIGTDNPGLTNGIGSTILSSVAQGFTPALGNEIEKDFNGVSREGKTIMGAFVQ